MLRRDESRRSAEVQLITDQTDAVGFGVKDVKERVRRHCGPVCGGEREGWVARIVHLFRAESLAVQFKVGFTDTRC